MRVIHLMGANTFTDPDTNTTWEAGDDGVFDLPEHVGAHYVTKHAGMFRRESDYEALIATRKTEALSDPRNTAPTLNKILDRVKALEDKVAAWETFFDGDVPPALELSETSGPDPEQTTAKDADPETPAEPDASDDSEDHDSDDGHGSDDGDGEPAGDTPLRKPSARKTAAKRRS